jgi:ER-bound oxygenase mpaB/B'/Rubber oxygenase, catalytic domain
MSVPPPLPRSVLDQLAQVGDPEADAVVDAVIDSLGYSAPELDSSERRSAYPEVVRRIGGGDDGGPVDDFVGGGADIDAQIDTDLVKHAQDFFENHGVAVITALFLASLPEAYLGRRGVQVLDMTGELVSNWSRRIQETGQFLINVMTPDRARADDSKTNLHHGEGGARVARRVRLAHSAVRWLLRAPYNPPLRLEFREALAEPRTLWHLRMAQIDEPIGPELSEPLNQEDLLGTLGTFTTVVFHALDKLAVAYDDRDREAYHHLWNIVGWHLGIGHEGTLPSGVTTGLDPPRWPGNEILPLTVEEMDAVFTDLRDRLTGGTEAGRRLAQTLVQDFAYPLPRSMQAGPAFVVRYLIGDDRANMLDIRGGGYTGLVVRRTGALSWLATRTRASYAAELVLSAVAQSLTRYALRHFVARSLESERGLRIEPHTASRWGIQIGPGSSMHETPAVSV